MTLHTFFRHYVCLKKTFFKNLILITSQQKEKFVRFLFSVLLETTSIINIPKLKFCFTAPQGAAQVLTRKQLAVPHDCGGH